MLNYGFLTHEESNLLMPSVGKAQGRHKLSNKISKNELLWRVGSNRYQKSKGKEPLTQCIFITHLSNRYFVPTKSNKCAKLLTSTLYQLFFIAMIKYQDKGNLQKGVFILDLQFQKGKSPSRQGSEVTTSLHIG